MKRQLKSIGVLSTPGTSVKFVAHRDDLLAMADALPEDLALKAAEYLRCGHILLPYMEWARDIIADRFGVSGACGIVTDGHYYWRGDAAEYVATYRIALPPEFIERMESLGWSVPDLDEDTIQALYDSIRETLYGTKPEG